MKWYANSFSYFSFENKLQNQPFYFFSGCFWVCFYSTCLASDYFETFFDKILSDSPFKNFFVFSSADLVSFYFVSVFYVSLPSFPRVYFVTPAIAVFSQLRTDRSFDNCIQLGIFFQLGLFFQIYFRDYFIDYFIDYFRLYHLLYSWHSS